MPELNLVTGATGFIGRALVRRLSEAGERVRCLVRPGGDISRLNLPGVEFFTGDLLDPACLPGALAGAGRVWHLAALVRPPGTLVSRKKLLEQFRAINEQAPARLAEAAAGAGVRRFIHFSSIAALGPGEDLGDGAEPKPLTYYGRSKLAGELLLKTTAATLGLDHIILRPSMIYGPGAAGWEPLFGAARRGRAAVPGNAANTVSVCYIENFLDAALLAAEKAPFGSAFNISEGSLSIMDLLFTLGAALDKSPALIPLPVALLKTVSAIFGASLGLTGLYLPGFMGADPARLHEACASWSHNCEGIRALGWKPAVPTARALAISMGTRS
ncbi:MAG TPA: hypothetical protein DEQ38_09460 [Elusimicrobia bacterium]|nr:MAG: hypothetical protein A2089_13555 [Elusimicrobia bacterium GWD2_63_28]HCC48322.1 hypothetical protein [Elusimicrobiota bacterium]